MSFGRSKYSQPNSEVKETEFLLKHKNIYNNGKLRIDREIKNIEEILDINEKLKKHRIMCQKFNYALDEIVQDFSSYPSIIEILNDGERLQIVNRKPIETSPRDDGTIMDPVMVNHIDDDPEFLQKLSSCSCDIEDIHSIHLGGFQSRFWMLRKHFISMDNKEIKQVPFYNWQCLQI